MTIMTNVVCKNLLDKNSACWYGSKSTHQIGTQLNHSAIIRKISIYHFQQRIRRKLYHLH